jgi:hypothetical protein
MDDIHPAMIDNPDLEIVTGARGERRKHNTIRPEDTLRMKNQRTMFPIFLDPKRSSEGDKPPAPIRALGRQQRCARHASRHGVPFVDLGLVLASEAKPSANGRLTVPVSALEALSYGQEGGCLRYGLLEGGPGRTIETVSGPHFEKTGIIQS